MRMLNTLIAALLLLVIDTTAQTYVSGDVGGQTWIPANSPYHVVGDLFISSADSLIISSGVDIEFLDTYNVSVDGVILAAGTETDSVNIRGTYDPEKVAFFFHSLEGLSSFAYCLLQKIDIYTQGSPYNPITMDRCLLDGVSFEADDTGGNELTNSTIYGSIHDGINWLIDGCTLYNWANDPNAGGALAEGIIGAHGTFTNNYIQVEANSSGGLGSAVARAFSQCDGWFMGNVIRASAHADLIAFSYGFYVCSGQCWNNLIRTNIYGIYHFSGSIQNNTFTGLDEFNRMYCGVQELLYGCSLKNCIFYDCEYGVHASIEAQYCCFSNCPNPLAGGATAGPGYFESDPLFVDPENGDFHLQSTVGSYHSGTWWPDAEHSPCIDAGDPNSSYFAEPEPNGQRVNLGAYGNTVEASLSNAQAVHPANADLPGQFALYDACPNPFNPTTVLSFELRVASYVTLTVFDIAGREVARLVDGQRDAGMHEVAFDGSNLSSGMYFYRLTAGDFSGVGKMALIK